ncbi:glutamyl-tRNA reductase [Paenibacillus thiaminolyticus]|uniref:Glutamyl-tRNA reductase n=1 Tax=Paenibacillus thiaminolyticus TaxID=49283 RepID=A0AAP9DXT3_PANTH|nr:glutamyl-tRNA reductase [Paenibacillus thiaminolyticus]MCY9537287.1 glutamyl-tRNA reductase [Paenibacillus thiaminolyticus]MCY9600032.1 glutamyl-tRNA reductase [Paenibacillus thiaminolyticus]MCY9610490.1 glutamyl-tRNA reductase [Paenibacillus thiaminolyticus]MCY9615721.1 glutamyl-tRNA reductase [Paenibacillus thiaminolyticus]MCY9617085.1 glutamyl-tRNA reductase [Paenibacillus thiaminolyticus]
MHIVVVGMNYRTAPVEIREKFALPEKDWQEAIRQLRNTKSVMECVMVSTCNRTEMYVVVDRLHMCGYFIRSFMEQWFGIPRQQFTPYLYIYEDDQAVEHLFRVTSGLDSMVIGETQILGQIRSAFLFAQREGTTGTWFNTLFKQAITMAKRAHAETNINDNAVSVSYAAVELGKRIFGSFQGKKVLILGAGKMSELTVKHLYSNGAAEVMVVNRTFSRARELAEQFHGRAGTLEDAGKFLRDADIVISSTGAQEYIMTAQDVERVMKLRKSRPLFLIDIAVPRDLDPEIGGVSNVFLYDIDDLEGIVESNLEQRRKEAAKIEAMIASELDEYRQWLKMLGVTPVIRALQTKAERIHQDTLESLFNKLPDLSEREAKLIRRLTKSMLNQMMHDPILQLKELAAEKNGEEALHLFTQLFALEETMVASEPDKGTKRESAALSSRRDEEPERTKPVLSWAAVTW